MKKTLLLYLLIIAILLPIFSACGGDDVNTTGTTANTEDTSSGEYLSEYDLGKQTISILYWDDVRMQEFVAESSSGVNEVNDALFTRNTIVESRQNVKLNFIGTEGGYGNDHANYYSKVETAARTGSGDYDILACYSCAIAYLSVNGYSNDLLKYDLIDFNADWWNSSLITNATIKGKLLFCAGDISTQLLYMMECVWFNTDMINAYGLENPYDLVANNEWTIDKMFSLGQGLYVDLDLDGKKSATDQFGIGTYSVVLEAFFYGSGITICKVVDGYPVMSPDYLGEKCYDLIVKLGDHFAGNDSYVNNDYDPARIMFGEGRSLFMIDSPFVVDTVLNLYENCNYGIVPAPKWEKTQDRYYTSVRTTCTFYSLFAGSQKAESAAVVMEALGYYGNKYVTPALFETTMKYQYALDDVGSQMFDLIKNTIIFDFGRSFDNLFSASPMGTVRTKIQQNDKNWISFAARIKDSFAQNIEKILSNFDKYYN